MGHILDYRKGLFKGYDTCNHLPEEKAFGKWKVEKHGDTTHGEYFFIPAAKIPKNDTLIIHMMVYEWIDFNTFVPSIFSSL